MPSTFPKIKTMWVNYPTRNTIYHTPCPSKVELNSTSVTKIVYSRGNTQFHTPHVKWMVSTRKQTRFSNSMVVSGMGVPLALDNLWKTMTDSSTDPIRTSDRPLPKKEAFIREQGYHLEVKWECEWRKMKQDNEDIQDFLNSTCLQSPVEPRDAFKGGRTNAIHLYHRVSGDDKIHYYDYTSLYLLGEQKLSLPARPSRNHLQSDHPRFKPILWNCQSLYRSARTKIHSRVTRHARWQVDLSSL